ncbi:hypothetical protein L596_023872 [Steinernema carpocapsae]|uniref:Uncharacterized protein n=1 Tax=Steinernema carpocapsae TaxID=34508 RepID=A0A4V5ZZK8_STECR|nr:hypothetical protein L596_023872 [Steinernema carpocapsae]
MPPRSSEPAFVRRSSDRFALLGVFRVVLKLGKTRFQADSVVCLPPSTMLKIPRNAVFVVAAIGVLANAQTFETGDNSTVTGCSSHCRVEDPTLECWNKTLNFFERVLLGQMRHYIAVQINIDQWHRRNDKHYVMDFAKVEQRAQKAMESHLVHDDLLNKTIVDNLVKSMIARVGEESRHEISWVPHFSCPLPCEHRSVVWRNLFIASMVLNVCLAIAVVPFIVQMVKHDNAHASESLIR